MTKQYGTLVDLYLQELFEFYPEIWQKYHMLDQDLNEVFPHGWEFNMNEILPGEREAIDKFNTRIQELSFFETDPDSIGIAFIDKNNEAIVHMSTPYSSSDSYRKILRPDELVKIRDWINDWLDK